MTIHVVSATEASRNLSEILNKVHYQGQSFEVKRGKEVIARKLPAAASLSKRKIGVLKGKVKIAKDFDAPLPDDLFYPAEDK